MTEIKLDKLQIQFPESQLPVPKSSDEQKKRVNEVVFKNLKSLSELSFKERVLHFFGFKKWVRISKDKEKNTYLFVTEKWLLNTLQMKSSHLKQYTNKKIPIEARLESLQTLIKRSQVTQLNECLTNNDYQRFNEILRMLEVNKLGAEECLQNLGFVAKAVEAQKKFEDLILQTNFRKAYQHRDFSQMEKLLNLESRVNNVDKEKVQESIQEFCDNVMVSLGEESKDVSCSNVSIPNVVKSVIIVAMLRDISTELLDSKRNHVALNRLKAFEQDAKGLRLDLPLCRDLVSGKKSVTSGNFDKILKDLWNAPLDVDKPVEAAAVINDKPLDAVKAKLRKGGVKGPLTLSSSLSKGEICDMSKKIAVKSVEKSALNARIDSAVGDLDELFTELEVDKKKRIEEAKDPLDLYMEQIHALKDPLEHTDRFIAEAEVNALFADM